MTEIQKTQGVNKTVWIVLVVLGLCAVSYYYGTSTHSASPSTTTAPTNNIDGPVKQADLTLASQCAADGKKFFDQWLAQQTRPTSGQATYDGPEYHYSTKYNTCLEYVALINTYSYSTAVSSHENFIYDIYANKVVLYSSTFRTCDGTSCSEKVNDSITSVPSLSSQDFYAQKAVMMAQ